MNAESLRGYFLISVKRMKDENFFRTVVLLLEHSKSGAMGVVINRPLDVTINEALSKHFDLAPSEELIYSGGPVEDSALLILHNSTDHDQEHPAVLPGVFVGTSPDIFDRVVAASHEPDPDFHFRLFAGYAGWGPQQLEEELSRGDWFTLPARAEYIFRQDPYEIWEDVLEEFHQQHKPLSGAPADAEWN